ncbi:MAG: hypothetical protein GY773_22820 [Actinomycetia bacterium]|nr:hypothetical protein [Actinomycetes bacterium]
MTGQLIDAQRAHELGLKQLVCQLRAITSAVGATAHRWARARSSSGQRRVLVIGHVATRWALQHYLEGRPLAELVTEGFDWQLGWEYQLSDVPAV